MADLKSRADELIHQFSCVVSDAAVDQLRGSDYAEKVQPPADALTRFVHALCECAELIKMAPCPSSNSPGHDQAWQCQWCDERKTALAALEKGEKV